jgi:hypothetical protein
MADEFEFSGGFMINKINMLYNIFIDRYYFTFIWIHNTSLPYGLQKILVISCFI